MRNCILKRVILPLLLYKNQNISIENDETNSTDLTISFQARLSGADSDQQYFWNLVGRIYVKK